MSHHASALALISASALFVAKTGMCFDCICKETYNELADVFCLEDAEQMNNEF